MLRAAFRPEFLNRLDAIVGFDRIDPASMRGIVDTEISKMATRLESAKDIRVEVDESLRDA